MASWIITLLFVGLLLMAGMAFVGQMLLADRTKVGQRVDRMMQGRVEKVVRTTAAANRSQRWLFSLGAGTVPPREERELLRRLGILDVPAELAGPVFFAFRLLLGVLLMAGLAFATNGMGDALPLALRLAACGLFGAAAGWFLPFNILSRLATRRVQTVERGLPDAIELLVVAVEAGLALEDSLERIVGELRRSQPALAEELAILVADLKLLPNREEALTKFGERIDRPTVRSVVTTLAQTMQYGTPLAQSLRVMSAELRNDTLVKLEERANRLPVLMTIPMIVFLLPAVFLIVGGPAVLHLMDAVGR
jgi:tight adherence protein C